MSLWNKEGKCLKTTDFLSRSVDLSSDELSNEVKRIKVDNNTLPNKK